MEENKQLYRFSYQLGDWLLLLIKLQFICLFYIVRGGILLGIFPAVATVMDYFLLVFQKKEVPVRIYPWFRQTYHAHFKTTNELGYILFAIIAFLWIDLRISSTFLQNSLIHFVLTLFFLSSILIGIYLFPVYLRYQLRNLQYFKLSFMLMLISIPQTLAIVLGVFVASVIATFFPILVITAFIPMVIFPISWFTFQAMQRAEKKSTVTE